MGFNLSDEFLRSNVDASGYSNGFTIQIKRNRFSDKVNVPSDYLNGYLRVAN